MVTVKTEVKQHATANMKKALEWVLPCRCLAILYHACFWFAAAFLPPLTYLLQVRLWWGPLNHLPLRFPHHQKLHMFVYHLMAQAT